MRKYIVILVFLGVMLFVIGLSMTSQANLVNPGLYTTTYQTPFGNFEPVIYDDVHQKYWYSSLPQTAGTFDQQMDFVNKLNNDTTYTNPAWSLWRLADSGDMQTLLSNPLDQISSHFFRTDDSWPHLGTWDGRYNQLPDDGSTSSRAVLKLMYLNPDPNNPFNEIEYSTSTGYVSDLSTSWLSVGGLGAWIVADGIQSVPEPSTILLLVSGLATLAGFGMRFKKL